MPVIQKKDPASETLKNHQPMTDRELFGIFVVCSHIRKSSWNIPRKESQVAADVCSQRRKKQAEIVCAINRKLVEYGS